MSYSLVANEFSLVFSIYLVCHAGVCPIIRFHSKAIRLVLSYKRQLGPRSGARCLDKDMENLELWLGGLGGKSSDSFKYNLKICIDKIFPNLLIFDIKKIYFSSGNIGVYFMSPFRKIDKSNFVWVIWHLIFQEKWILFCEKRRSSTSTLMLVHHLTPPQLEAMEVRPFWKYWKLCNQIT